jgi:predicted enzyme related to lactoylglutathione lyase
MLGNSDIIAVVATADLRRAQAFYETVLGLQLTELNDFACVFNANGTMLRVTAVREVARPGYTVLGWQVADIAATVREMSRKGVAFCRYEGMRQDKDGIWTTPGGGKVAWFTDPDGNTLSLTEFPSQ